MSALLDLNVPYDVIIDDVEEHLAEGQRDLEESRKDMHVDSAVFFINILLYLFFYF